MKAFTFFSGIAVLVVNILTIITSSIYFAFPSNLVIWNINGILILFSIFLNSVYLAYLGKTTVINIRALKVARILTYVYYLFVNVACFVLFSINFVGYTSNPSINVLFSTGLLTFFLMQFIIPSVIIALFLKKEKTAKIDIAKSQISTEANAKKHALLRKVGKSLLFIEGGLGLGFGLIAIIIFFAPKIHNTFFFFMSVFFAPISIFLGIVIFNSAMLLIHLINTKAKMQKILVPAVVIVGLAFTSIAFVPAAYIPYTIKHAEQEFSEAFNPYFGDWEEVIKQSGYEQYLLESPFQLTGYFLGNGNPKCKVLTDILYFDGSKSNYSVDKNIKLYFDVYMPAENSKDLPGKNATIIRIHGGGWVLGDKGLMNMPMVNRYLASQGYIVFDIQYGLNNNTPVFGSLRSGPPYVYGSFIIDDMLRHIGNFTFYLEQHANEYGANLSSVFISGGSAGGQLACATALSIASGNYTNIFSDKLNIKGLIPFYPANNVKYDFATQSREEWVNPSLLINENSPPCLIFQGEKDRLIEESKLLKTTYLSYGRTDCALLTFPYGSHAADIYFPGHFNRIFLYYMERFLILYNL